jgi:hypothetical protein
MKIVTALLLATILSACTTAEPRPGRLQEVTLDDGRVVEMYIFGYSVEDFKCEFERGEPRPH